MKFHATGKVLSLWPGPFVALWLGKQQVVGELDGGIGDVVMFFVGRFGLLGIFHGLMPGFF